MWPFSKNKQEPKPTLNLLKNIIKNQGKDNVALNELIKSHQWEEIRDTLLSNSCFNFGDRDNYISIEKIDTKQFNSVKLLIDQNYYNKQVKARRKFKAVITLITALSAGMLWPLTRRIYKDVKDAEPVQRRGTKKMQLVIKKRPSLKIPEIVTTTGQMNRSIFNKRNELIKQIERKEIDPEQEKLNLPEKEKKASNVKYAYMSQEQAEIVDVLYKYFNKKDRFFKPSKEKQERRKEKVIKKVQSIKTRSLRNIPHVL